MGRSKNETKGGEVAVNVTSEEQENKQKEREIRFGRRLASSDKKLRDKAVKKLRGWLSAQQNTSLLDNQKIWKGLFYCVYMSDKPLIQEELVSQISKLVHCTYAREDAICFMKAFFMIMVKEWNGVDRLRLDKFYMLVRECLLQFFTYVKSSDFEFELVSEFTEVIAKGVLAPESKVPNGLRWFIIEKYLTQLGRVVPASPPMGVVGADGELVDEEEETVNTFTMDVMMLLLSPFYNLMACEKDKITRKKITENVFSVLFKRENEEVDKVFAGVEDNDEEDGDNTEKYFPVDWESMSELLFLLASRKEVADANRNDLYKLKKEVDAIIERIGEIGKVLNLQNGLSDSDADDNEQDDNQDAGTDNSDDEEVDAMNFLHPEQVFANSDSDSDDEDYEAVEVSSTDSNESDNEDVDVSENRAAQPVLVKELTPVTISGRKKRKLGVPADGNSAKKSKKQKQKKLSPKVTPTNQSNLSKGVATTDPTGVRTAAFTDFVVPATAPAKRRVIISEQQNRVKEFDKRQRVASSKAAVYDPHRQPPPGVLKPSPSPQMNGTPHRGTPRGTPLRRQKKKL
eukprot:CFRG1287T1